MPREFFAGGPNPVVLRIRNRLARVPPSRSRRRSTRVRDGRGRRTAGRCFLLRVGPKAVDRSKLHMGARIARRARAFSSLRVSTRFPFGLFVKSLEFDAAEPVLVYPLLQVYSHEPPDQRSKREVRRSARAFPRRRRALTGLREFVRGDADGPGALAAQRAEWPTRRRRTRRGNFRRGRGPAPDHVRDDPRAQVESRVSKAASEVVHHLDAGHRVGLRARAVRFAPAKRRGPSPRAPALPRPRLDRSRARPGRARPREVSA